MHILRNLLYIQSKLYLFSTAGDYGSVEDLDDEERYIKMSMKIDSSDPMVLKRNEDKL